MKCIYLRTEYPDTYIWIVEIRHVTWIRDFTFGCDLLERVLLSDISI